MASKQYRNVYSLSGCGCAQMFFLFLAFFLNGGIFEPSLIAQVKFEKETRINRTDVPQNAGHMIELLELDEKVRWFKEKSENGVSYEAKYKRQNRWHSIEFDSIGRFQDAEIDIREREVPEEVRLRIHHHLKMEFDHHRLRKIQRQLTGPEEDIRRALVKEIIPSGLVVKYEIIVKGRSSGETHLYEYLFSDSGELERRARIVLRNTDHLIY